MDTKLLCSKENRKVFSRRTSFVPLKKTENFFCNEYTDFKKCVFFQFFYLILMDIYNDYKSITTRLVILHGRKWSLPYICFRVQNVKDFNGTKKATIIWVVYLYGRSFYTLSQIYVNRLRTSSCLSFRLSLSPRLLTRHQQNEFWRYPNW